MFTNQFFFLYRFNVLYENVSIFPWSQTHLLLSNSHYFILCSYNNFLLERLLLCLHLEFIAESWELHLACLLFWLPRDILDKIQAILNIYTQWLLLRNLLLLLRLLFYSIIIYFNYFVIFWFYCIFYLFFFQLNNYIFLLFYNTFSINNSLIFIPLLKFFIIFQRLLIFQ